MHDRTPRRQWLTISSIGFVVVLISSAIWWLAYARAEIAVERLLVQAYAKYRTLEFRIPGAPYASLRRERSSDTARRSAPVELLEAHARIARELEAQPGSRYWRRAKGRADLLSGNTDEAVAALEDLLRLDPDSNALRMELACALFERGRAQSSLEDFARAIDLLGKVLRASPNNSTALFNRAIVLERTMLLSQAREDWQRYLRVERNGAWRREAVERLKVLNLNWEVYEEFGPGEALSLLQERSPEGQRQIVEENSEEMLRSAVKEWLPLAYPGTTPHDGVLSAKALDGLASLAQTLRDKHGDGWLHDLLAKPAGATFASAVAELAEASRAIDAARFKDAAAIAERAEILFRKIHNDAGEMQARLQKTSSLRFASASGRCIPEGQSLLVEIELSRKTYYQLAAQTKIETGLCLLLSNEFDSAEALLASAMEDAAAHKFRVTQVRAASMKAGIEWRKGNRRNSWAGILAVIEVCMSRPCPRRTVSSLMAAMQTFTRTSEQWDFQSAAAREAVKLIEHDPDMLLRAVEHNRLARTLRMLGNDEEAELQFAQALSLLRAAPQDEVTLSNIAAIQVDRARMALEHNDRELVRQLLTQAQRYVEAADNLQRQADFHYALALLHIQDGNFAEARSQLYKTIEVAETELGSLGSSEERLAWIDARAPVYRSAVTVELLLGDARRALALWEWYLNGPAGNVSVPGKSFGAFEELLGAFLQGANVDNSVARISYFADRERIGVWVIRGKQVSFFWLPAPADYTTRLARTFTRISSSPAADHGEVRSLARAAYDALFMPVRAAVGSARSVVVEGDSVIVGMPFEALIDPEGRWLGSVYLIAFSPGMYYRSDGFDNRLIALDSNALVGVVATGDVFGEFLPPLHDAVREGRAVAHRFRSARLLEGQEVSAENLKRELGTASVFHFAGHAVSSRQATGLVLAQKSGGTSTLLTASEVGKLNLSHMRLAVLSSCTTFGAGTADPASVARAFIEAGVQNVVGSRWKVDSGTTEKLINAFYDALFEGNSVPAALQQAQDHIRKSAESAHPFYWAAFSVYRKE